MTATKLPVSPALPPLRLMLYEEKPALTVAGDLVTNIFYRLEASRGYEAQGVLWSPGYFTSELSPGRSATLVASTEPWNIMCALKPEEALTAECERRERLLLAADRKARHRRRCRIDPGCRSIHHHSRWTHRGCRARACGRR